MAINTNYGLLQKQIADEMGDDQQLLAPLSGDSGLASPIQNAIQSAIAKWERIPFYFNDFLLVATDASPFQTVIGQEFYSAADYAPLATLARITSMQVLISQNRYPVKERDSDYLNNISLNAQNTGQPTDYAFLAEQVRLYSIPNAVYPLGLTGTLRLTTLSEDSDSNAWTEDAFDLIRCEAKLVLARDVINDAEVEAACNRAIYGAPDNPTDVGYLVALKKETTQRRASRSRIRPTYF